MNHSAFDQIQPSENPSIPELLFFARQRDEISEKDYFISSAVWVAENVSKYRPLPFAQLSQTLAQYVSGRLRGGRSAEQDAGYDLGVWIWSSVRIQNINNSNKSLLFWAKEKCEANGLQNQVGMLTHAISLFDQNNNFSLSEFLESKHVQELDSRERVRKSS